MFNDESLKNPCKDEEMLSQTKKLDQSMLTASVANPGDKRSFLDRGDISVTQSEQYIKRQKFGHDHGT